MDDRLYKIRLIILWAVVGLLVLVGGALLALQTDAGKAYVLAELTDRLNNRLAGEVEANQVSGPLLWRATLHDVAVRDARANEMLGVEEVELTYSLAALFSGDFEFGRVSLEQPELTVHRYEDGTLNLATLVEPAAGPKTAVETSRELFSVPRFEISSGTLHYEDYTFTDIHTEGHLRVSSGGVFEAAVDELAVDTDAGPLPRSMHVVAQDVRVEALPGALEFAAAEVEVDEVSVIGDIRLTRTKADDAAPGQLAGEIEALTITPRLAEWWSPNLDLIQPIDVDVAFQGTPADLVIDGVAAVDKGGEIAFEGQLDTTAASLDLAVEADEFQSAAWVEREGASVGFDAAGTIEARRADSGAIEASTRLSATDVVFGESRISQLVLGAEEPFAIHLEPAGGDPARSDPVRSDKGRRRIKADGHLAASGVKGEDFAFDTLDTRIAVTAPSLEPGVPINYDVAGSAGGAKYGEHAADSARFDLVGTLTRTPQGAVEAGPKVTAEGVLDLRGYKGTSFQVNKIDTRLDIEHTPATNTGTIRADLGTLVAEERTYGSGRINLAMEQGGGFRVSLRAAPRVAPQLPLSLSAVGVHGEDFEIFELAKLQIGRPGLQWKLRDRATIRLGEEDVVIESLVLHGPAQAIRLDGTYPREGALAAIIERLSLASLEQLLQSERVPEQLRERLPKNLEDLAPKELEDAIPKEVEDRLSDEIRKRLPQF